jgi:outer membrane protein assembly factor BamB
VPNPTACKRLPNGNTFIATQRSLMEIDPKGTVLYTHNNPSNNTIARALRLPNGNVLFADYTPTLIETDAAGKVVRTVKVPTNAGSWTGVELLPGGRFLVSLRTGKKVLELDAAGKILWQLDTPELMSAVRLPNGNTVVGADADHCVIEYDRAGKEVWKLKTEGRPYGVRRY